jgi:2'-5' RNA ligase
VHAEVPGLGGSFAGVAGDGELSGVQCAVVELAQEQGVRDRGYTAHLTVGLDTVEHLNEMQAEPFEAFDVHPLALAVYQLGNNGTARQRLKTWALNA